MAGFDKMIPSTISEYKLYDVKTSDELEKVASSDIDLPEGFVFDPDYLYLWVRIISAGEFYGPNKNGDYFPEEELVNSYETFNTAHVFKNHENKKVENAIGQIISVRWNPIMKCVEIFKGIDRKVAPEIVRGFLKGYLTDVSMGCKVPYTICSVCGNKARTQKEFCKHIRENRMDYLGNGERVFEINRDPKFHDSSAVLNGAERVAKALVIIDAPVNSSAVSFKKTASENGVSRYIKLSDEEMSKVAHFSESLHPMLLDWKTEKTAATKFMQKIAELEKEVTGKLMNIVSAPENHAKESAKQMLTIIKFLTEKRFDEDSLHAIASTLKEVANAEGVSKHQAFSTLLGMAELMGIEFFPSELHTILSDLTDAKFVKELSISGDSDGDVYPSDFAKGIKQSPLATNQLPSFDDPSSIFEMYNEGAHRVDVLQNNPLGFLDSLSNHFDLDSQPSVKVVRIIHKTLEPMMPFRSQQAEFLLPRLSAILSGHQPIIGDASVGRDLNILSAPKTLGDVLASLAYKNYQDLRPTIRVTRLVKMASSINDGFEKKASLGEYVNQAKEQMAYNHGKRDAEREIFDKAEMEKMRNSGKGISRRKLFAMSLPVVYATSVFEKNRREHGRNLSDAENFVADHPGIVSGGIALAGKPLTANISKATGTLKRNIDKKIVKPLTKTSSAIEFESIVKLADSYPSGQFNAFTDEMLGKFASVSGLTPEELIALKTASLLSIGGFEKEASEISKFYELPEHAIGMFLKEATAHVEEEMEKAADDFFNTMLLDSVADARSMSNTLPGRVLDAFVFKQLAKAGNKQQPINPNSKTPEMKGEQ
jgi:hypothetical protein